MTFDERGFVEERTSPSGVRGKKFFLRVAEEDGLDAEDFLGDGGKGDHDDDGFSGDGDYYDRGHYPDENYFDWF
jgi:hypothetical protein